MFIAAWLAIPTSFPRFIIHAIFMTGRASKRKRTPSCDGLAMPCVDDGVAAVAISGATHLGSRPHESEACFDDEHSEDRPRKKEKTQETHPINGMPPPILMAVPATSCSYKQASSQLLLFADFTLVNVRVALGGSHWHGQQSIENIVVM